MLHCNKKIHVFIKQYIQDILPYVESGLEKNVIYGADPIFVFFYVLFSEDLNFPFLPNV